MRNILKNKKLLIAGADALLLPCLLLCEKLSDLLLSAEGAECLMLRLGGKCVACGGTHFVNALLNGDLAGAFGHNPFLFVLTAVLAGSFILLNLYLLSGWNFAGTVLKKIYSIPGLVISTCAMLIFFLIRVSPIFMRLIQLLAALA